MHTTYLRGGDNPRDGILPASTCDVEAIQLVKVIVATQLDDLTREQEENEVSSSEGSRSSSEESVLPGMQGIFLKQASRDLELTTAMIQAGTLLATGVGRMIQ